MENGVNREIRLAARPVGFPKDSDFELAETPIPEPGEGEVLVRNVYMSVDPYMRSRMIDRKSYVPSFRIGEPLTGGAVGQVVESRSDALAVGDWVNSMQGWREYYTADGGALMKLDPELVPVSKALGVLGLTGWTAYVGLLDLGQPKEGETVFVSAASGAVGSIVGQLAKLKGCRAIGIAGGPEKCAMVVDELGFDAAIDYREEDVKKALRGHAPDGIDVYFDNVGGEILDAALARLAFNARVVICGAISQYNSTERMRGPSNYMSLLVNHASMTGFLVFHYASRYAEGARQMGEWVAADKLQAKEDVVSGIEQFPQALLKLFEGTNDGKLVLAVRD